MNSSLEFYDLQVCRMLKASAQTVVQPANLQSYRVTYRVIERVTDSS